MKHFLLRFCSFELTRVSTYLNISNEFRSERSCFAFSLPKSEAKTRKWASRTASLARDTSQERRKTHKLPNALSIGIPNFQLDNQHFPLNQTISKHAHLPLKTWLPCPTPLESKLTSLPKSQLHPLILLLRIGPQFLNAPV